MFVDVVINDNKETVCVNIDAIQMVTKIEDYDTKYKFRLHFADKQYLDIKLDDYWAIKRLKNGQSNYIKTKAEVQEYIHARKRIEYYKTERKTNK